MTNAEPGLARNIRHEIEANGLGLAAYPVGTLPNEALDDHIMGVVAMAWLTHYPVDVWGRDWLSAGCIDMRFQRHLQAGRRLETMAEVRAEAEADAATITLSVRDAAGIDYVSGSASLAVPSTDPRESVDSLGVKEPTSDAVSRPAAPTPEALAGLIFDPLHFRFDAARDLAFVAGLPDADFWRSERTAHPAWLGSAANAITRNNIDFGSGGRWLHAGLRVDLHAPVEDGASLEIAGRIESLFERRGRRFAVAALAVRAGSRVIASLRNTFVYAVSPDAAAPIDGAIEGAFEG